MPGAGLLALTGLAAGLRPRTAGLLALALTRPLARLISLPLPLALRARALTAGVKRDGARPPWRFIGPKREKQLLQTAATAYRKLAALED